MNSMRYHSKIDALFRCSAPFDLWPIPEPSFLLQHFHPCLPLNFLNLLSSLLFGPSHHIFFVIVLELACRTAVSSTRKSKVFILVFLALAIVGFSDLVGRSVSVLVDETTLGFT